LQHAHPTGRNRTSRGAFLAVAVLLAALVAKALLDGAGTPASAAPPKPLRPRAHVSVLVLNGNGASGVAGALANRLLARGYREAAATNAPVTTYARSLILFRNGWAGEAERLAKDTGIRTVVPLDGSLPPGSGRFQVVAILGR